MYFNLIVQIQDNFLNGINRSILRYMFSIKIYNYKLVIYNGTI